MSNAKRAKSELEPASTDISPNPPSNTADVTGSSHLDPYREGLKDLESSREKIQTLRQLEQDVLGQAAKLESERVVHSRMIPG